MSTVRDGWSGVEEQVFGAKNPSRAGVWSEIYTTYLHFQLSHLWSGLFTRTFKSPTGADHSFLSCEHDSC